MTEDEMIEQFENCTLPEKEFHHEMHVRMAWAYLCRHPVLEAIRRFSDALKAYAASLGHAGLYHETITWGHIFLIHERMVRAANGQTWEEFAAANADLLDWRGGIFRQYYSDEVIASDIAKRVFVLPDIVSRTAKITM
jgi:hypothetical protein